MIQQLPTRKKLKLVPILLEELESGWFLILLVPNSTDNLPTPYYTFTAKETLKQFLKTEEDQEGN